MAVQLSTDADFSALVSNNQKVMVKYFADWCGTCKLFAPKFRRMSDDAENAGIAFLEVNAEENPEARRMAGVNNLPYIAVFKDGVMVDGAATGKEDKVLDMLSKLKN